jgi:hypothetical protein
VFRPPSALEDLVGHERGAARHEWKGEEMPLKTLGLMGVDYE